MPISRDNTIIKEIGKKLRKSLTENEIGFLTQTLDESEELLFVSTGFLKRSSVDYKGAKIRMEVPVWSTKKYVALTDNKVMGFDDEHIVTESIADVDLIEIDLEYTRASSLIFLTTTELDFILLGAPQSNATKIFEHLRKIIRARHREHEMRNYVHTGTWNREDIKDMFLDELAKDLGSNRAVDYEAQVLAYINEIFSPPKHHGA